MQATSHDESNGRAILIIRVLTLMAVGRAMTLGWIHRVGDGGPGDPPEAWLMPLVGDAFVGITALMVAMLLFRQLTMRTWTIAVVWTSIAAFDAFAALLVEVSVPWPDFVMLRLFGRGMFVAAAVLHLIVLWLLTRGSTRLRFATPVG